MTTLHSFLSSPKVKKTLTLKPGDEGFSLIELVVVVAVLAVLAAIAIPNFQSMTTKARNAAAANTVATIAKECAVKDAQGLSGTDEFIYAQVSLDGYDSFEVDGSTTDCATEGEIIASSSDESKYATFTYDIATGDKTCEMDDGSDRGPTGCSDDGRW